MNPRIDEIVDKIGKKIQTGELQPGQRLDSERKIAEDLSVSRLHVREALKKLEQFGLVEIRPQSGAYICNLNPSAIEHIISDMLKVKEYDFASLVYVRVLLEKEAARLACQMRTDEDLKAIKAALDSVNRKFNSNDRIPLDFAYHQAISRASHNPVITSLLLMIVPDVLHYYNSRNVCQTPEERVKEEHILMYKFLCERDSENLLALLDEHFKMLVENSKTL